MATNISSIDYGNSFAETNFKDEALALAQQGYAVFPLTPRDKVPLKDSNGCKDATADVDQVQRLWSATPNANIGIATGAPSRVVVLDIDGPEGEERLRALELEFGALPETLQASTSRGRHLYFRDPGDLRNSASQLGKKLDIRADGGYVVAPPSIHPDGSIYQWASSLPPADAPDWLITKLRAPKRRANPVAANDNGIPEGQRNSMLASLAGTLRHKGIEGESLERVLQETNETSCDPPLGPREVSRIADSISRYPAEQNFACTDLGNSQRFIALHGNSLRYVPLWKKWVIWNGARWCVDDKLHVHRLAREVIEAISLEASFAEDEKQATALRKHMTRSQARPKLEAIEKLAQAELSISPDELDREPWLFNVQNGTIDLRTGDFRTHERADFITMMAPCEYDPSAKSPLWDAFLIRIFEENEDLLAFVQRLCGYLLTGDTTEQALFVLYGTGANGKSTFVETLLALLGDFGKKTAMQTFLEQRNEGVRNDLAGLRSARMVSAVEASKGKFLNEALVKEVTGGDQVSARFLYGEFFQYKPQYKIVLAVNDKPRIKGGDEGIWRRMELIPFNVFISPEQRDRELPQKLLMELPGILNWALAGLAEWRRIGLAPPSEVLEATEDYRVEMDLLHDFLQTCCADKPGWFVPTADLYAVYEQWCKDNGETPVKQRSFSIMIKERGYEPATQRVSGKQKRGFLDLEIIDFLGVL
jgi:putative DNA primase/helicase